MIFRKIALLLSVLALAVSLFGCGGSGTPSAFAGNYSGTYIGDSSGTWSLVINNSGQADFLTVPGGQDVTVHASVVANGHCSGSGSTPGNNTVTWVGTFDDTVSPITCSGTWSSTAGQSGTWSGSQN